MARISHSIRRAGLATRAVVVLLACLWLQATCAAELTISAAASLSNAFRALGASYAAIHPDTELLLNFAPSDALVQQLAAGAAVDVLATADQESMDKAAAWRLIAPATRRDFASNSLVVIIPADAKFSPTRLAQLAQPAFKRIALGNPAGVPAGRYAQRALKEAALWPLPADKAIYAQSVRQALDYVARGEVDAGLVYATDASMHQDKVKLAFIAPLSTPIVYPLAVTADSRNAAGAAQFIAYLTSPAGQAILARFGFRAP